MNHTTICQKKVMEVGSVVRVLRDFLTLNEGELSVVKGTIHILRKHF